MRKIREWFLYSIIALTLVSNLAFAGIDYYLVDNDVIVDAIYKAEGGAKAKYPYGVISIDTKGDVAYARKICYNTVRNNKKRFLAQELYTDYIEFLGSRYCPIGASNDPKGLNKNWVRLVKYFINKDK
jgi:hypothetical protein